MARFSRVDSEVRHQSVKLGDGDGDSRVSHACYSYRIDPCPHFQGRDAVFHVWHGANSRSEMMYNVSKEHVTDCCFVVVVVVGLFVGFCLLVFVCFGMCLFVVVFSISSVKFVKNLHS